MPFPLPSKGKRQRKSKCNHFSYHASHLQPPSLWTQKGKANRTTTSKISNLFFQISKQSYRVIDKFSKSHKARPDLNLASEILNFHPDFVKPPALPPVVLFFWSKDKNAEYYNNKPRGGRWSFAGETPWQNPSAINPDRCGSPVSGHSHGNRLRHDPPHPHRLFSRHSPFPTAVSRPCPAAELSLRGLR